MATRTLSSGKTVNIEEPTQIGTAFKVKIIPGLDVDDPTVMTFKHWTQAEVSEIFKWAEELVADHPEWPGGQPVLDRGSTEFGLDGTVLFYHKAAFTVIRRPNI